MCKVVSVRCVCGGYMGNYVMKLLMLPFYFFAKAKKENEFESFRFHSIELFTCVCALRRGGNWEIEKILYASFPSSC